MRRDLDSFPSCKTLRHDVRCKDNDLFHNDKTYRLFYLNFRKQLFWGFFWLTRKILCLPKDHRQSIEKKVKIYNPSELSSKLLYLWVEWLGRCICCTVDKIVEYFIFHVTYSVSAVLKESLAKALTLSYHFCMLSYAEIHVDLVLLNIMRRECTIEYASLRSG